ncbi:MAG: FAD-dependent oxidoreductase [Candidatus Heimdallarchaeaceae archaeon]
MEESFEQVDVIIVGSGGGGMTAALVAKQAGLDVIILEKSGYYGGSTALSGGGIWVPNNHLLRKAGIDDSPEKARLYLDSVVGDIVTPEKKDAYIEFSPKMIMWLETYAGLKFISVPWYSDYHPDQPGGLAEGRSLEVKPFNGRFLRRELKYLNPSAFEVPLNMAFTISEYHDLGMVMSTWRGKMTALRVGIKTILNLFLRRKPLTMGQGLIGQLRNSLIEADIPLLLNSPVVDLIKERSRITGVIVEEDDKQVKIKAKKGVILAAGGFAHNLAMRQEYHPSPVTINWTVAHKDNTGDAILAGMKLGAAVDLMDDAWWGPSSINPEGNPFFHVGERGYPGSIMVNKKGKRFTNESASYVVVVHEMFDKHKGDDPHIPCYFIFDQRFKNHYLFGTTFPRQKFPRSFYEFEYVTKSDTISGLAYRLNIDKNNFEDTIERFNEFARSGKDLDFGRGENAYDNYFGDPNVLPNHNLAPIENPPYYAVEIVPGDLGTKGGLLTNEYGQVLMKDGSIIKGLYAIGNSSASVMGNSYPGPGGTIGPSMTFGYLAAKHIALDIYKDRSKKQKSFV